MFASLEINMDKGPLKELCSGGEDSRLRFMRSTASAQEIADEMIAFANCSGGTMLFGIDPKTGLAKGLPD